MKIFDWVHRRFNPVILRDELGGGKNDSGCMALGLQDGVDLSHVLDGWKDFGILNIGTFGYDPLKHLEQDPLAKEDDLEMDQGFPAEAEIEVEVDDLLEEEAEELEEAADAEFNPLIPAKVVHELQEFGASTPATWDQAGASSKVEIMSIKKRVTLADLFSVDSDAKDGQQVTGDSPTKVSSKCGEKQVVKKDANERSLAKKILKGIKKEDLRSMRKINCLMRKMMGRKIHPEVPGVVKANEKENQLLTGKINPGAVAAKGKGPSTHEVVKSCPLLQSHHRDGTR